MNELQIFKNQEFGTIRTTEIDGEPYFVGKDVAEVLGYSNTNDALNKHCRGVAKRYPITDSLGRVQEARIISEGDMYRLIASSKLPAAEKFESWIFDDVVPTIRKHGAYMTPEALEKALLNPDSMIKVLQALKDERDKTKKLTAENSELSVQNEIYRPKAEYFDELVDRKLLTNFTDTAKELGVKRKKFIQFLLEHKYIYRDKLGNIKPYAQYADTDDGTGLFHIKDSINEKTEWSGQQTLVTVKGKETFRLLMTEA